jgi:hypothetical protein
MALLVALELASAIPFLTISYSVLFFRTSSTVNTLSIPYFLSTSIPSALKLYPGKSAGELPTLSVSRQDKYFLFSPITTTFPMNYKASLIAASIGTGATFSPPAVINNSLDLPVINKF